MKYLITGGAGFIGGHLVKRLIRGGDTIEIVDDMSVGKFLGIAPKNILDDIGATFREVDVVFHLAAFTRPRESVKNPKKTFEVNVEGTRNVLDYCLEHEVKRVVFTSSAAVYGSQSKYPTREDADLNPESPYAVSKCRGEELCREYGKKGLEFNIVRPFNVYGKGQDPSGPYGAAVPKFIDRLERGKRPYITGDGKQFRDFVYIDDIVELLIRASKSAVHGEVFNGGSGKSTTINDLYRLICKLMSRSTRPEHIEEIVEPMTRADIAKAEEMLGWVPKYSLEEGLRRTI